ncbi:metallophosphoesterase [Pendulispora albinea]|uniref:Metallophosphoesterase n=1 Tax=Pendulispora albinea TaxID=2741071 RepID=A0ABZ2LYC0_9BACT
MIRIGWLFAIFCAIATAVAACASEDPAADGESFEEGDSLLGGRDGPVGDTGVTPIKVAFIGDSGKGTAFKSVLSLIKAEKVDAVIHNGDFDYARDPDAFFQIVDKELGASFPYFGSVGNHDASSWSEYTPYFKSHIKAAGAVLDNDNLDDQKYAVTWKGLHFVFVGENGKNSEFADFIDDQFTTTETAWKICGWHKNQKAMQIGGKSDEMGWGVYENCRKKGAIVTTGHEHSYERTKTLTSMTNQTVDSACSDPKKVCVSPGRTFAFVSGLGGIGVRDQERCLPATPPYGCKKEWASIYASNQKAKYGVLFITFNVGGDPNKARGQFKNVDKQIIDDFEIVRGQ